MKIEKLVLIAQNSALHLESVIEDALDITRLENNKFSLFYDSFDIRGVCNEVADIMKF
jgi:signal transduction histidine kinase